MAEFKAQAGALGGREERTDAFAGEPRAIGSTLGNGGSHTLGGPGAAGTTSVTDGDARNGVSGTRTVTAGTGLGKGMSQGSTGMTGSSLNSAGATGEGNTTGTAGKPGLRDRMNPEVDTDGDRKARFMD
jgi:hypothetical protein